MAGPQGGPMQARGRSRESRRGQAADLADDVVGVVGEDNSPGRSHTQTGGVGELRGGSRSAVAGIPGDTVTGDGVDIARLDLHAVVFPPDGGNEPDHVVAGVAEEEVAGGVDGNTLGSVDPGSGGGLLVPLVPLVVRSGTGEG